ncbi:MAG TPA: dienelactone hydrolase family protein [Thermomicrobiales bacterium]|nr:dienelactone hydrolase family protein [Thermomicrobiales bacterium]
MKMQPIPYRDGATPLTGYLVWDDARDERRPGVLVVHGGAGLDEHAQGRARRLADLGFVVLACDMYGDGVAGDRARVMARITDLSTNPDRLCRRAQAGIEVLAAHPLVDGRLAAVGYCFGGMAVLELARGGVALAGVVSVHGGLKTTRPAQPATVRAKILVCHGALDPHVPLADVTAFVEEMNHAGADWQLIVYGGAMHGFTHEHAVAGATPGVAYHAPTDARSAAALQRFFAEIFDGDAGEPGA